MSSSAEGGTDGSAYRSEFRNLFGGDSNVEEEEAGGRRENRNKDGLDVVRSVQPSSLLSEAPMQMVEGEATNGPENNITPSILLEQLAYVDNFMPSLEQDFANLDSWILQDTGAGGGGGGESAGMMASGQGVSEGGGGIGFDERLAAELSAFADDSFIFPDEDKRTAQGAATTSGGMPGGFDSGNGDANGGANGDAVPNANNSENASNDNDERQQQQRANGRRSAHFLTQRRNTFLTSQYDYSKSRFSSKSREKREAQDQQQQQQQQQQQEEDGNEFFNISVGGSPLQDHGGFTNVDIVSGSGSVRGASNNNDNDNRSPRLTQHSPNIPSPLNNVLATTSSQPYSVSASPIITDQQDTTTQSRPQIHVPDYSTLPTSTLVALLPRISVPRGAQKTLANSGFSQEQIDAVAVIIAYNEQEKLKRQHNQGSASGDIRSSNNNVNDQDASRGAEFLLGILSQGSKPQQQPQQQRREQQQGFVESLLQLDHPRSSTHDQGEDLERSISHDEGQQRIKRENSVTGLLGSEEEEEEEKDVITTSVRPLKRSRSTEETLPSINTNGSTKRRNGSSGAILSSLPTAAATAATGSTSAAHVQKTHQRRKVKEKELENSVTELSELAVSLQQKIHTLEMENKLLKNLVRSSGELEGIEKAENIKRQIIDKINDSSGGGE